jgi:hypothetical protein
MRLVLMCCLCKKVESYRAFLALPVGDPRASQKEGRV